MSAANCPAPMVSDNEDAQLLDLLNDAISLMARMWTRFGDAALFRREFIDAYALYRNTRTILNSRI